MRTTLQGVVLIMAFTSHYTTHAADGDSYIDGEEQFVRIEDVNREAGAWGTCAAAFDITAEIMAGDSPAQSQAMHNLANGCKLAVVMAIVVDGINESGDQLSQERFNALWTTAQLAGQSISETRTTSIMADAERLSSSDRREEFLKKLISTTKICMKNGETQQFYVDTWRELLKSGLVSIPD